MRKNYFLILIILCLGYGKINAQFSLIYSFKNTDGKEPNGNLTIFRGKLYGMTQYGGANNQGSIFSIDSNGNRYKDLLDFNGANGYYPVGSLVISNGRLYGMVGGGVTNHGNIFSLDTNGTGYRDLHDFTVTDGANPAATLILAGNVLYGMANAGGVYGDGCVFAIDSDGTNYHKLLDFNGTNGANPYGALTLSGKMLFGMTYAGGTSGDGCIFHLDTNGGEYMNLHNFDYTHGAQPKGDVILSGNMMYGMTPSGGNFWGTVFSMDTNGSGFSVIHNFNDTIGAIPDGDLIFVGGLLYGMASTGTPSFTYGCVFSINPNGSGYTDLHNFSPANGETPYGSLSLYRGTLYGMTVVGGTNSDGVIFGITNIVTVSGEMDANMEGVKLFPNPTYGKLTVEQNGVNEKTIIEVYSILGEKIYSGALNITNTEIDLSDHSAGIYLYRILSLSGNLVAGGKFIIH